MKNILFSLFLVLAVSVVSATEKEIIAEVVFENLTDKEFTSGEFRIIDLNQKIEITKAENFKITLPHKGKYQFSFVADDFTAYTFYPVRINKRKNSITIQLVEKYDSKSVGNYSFPMNLETDLSDDQIEERISDEQINFIMHGIDATIPEEYIAFKEKYGIGLIKENCLVDPLSFKKATENNQMIFDFLNKKYGSNWINELKAKPFGLK
ncbi:hypothetical protein NMK71_05470 [Weeksellaceae bacterium KMM 9713]|uniref:DUF4369 domain-containing protein n=1 Tax=Profundicola chukchiensis TaxID=2961959 RepID=A0A9X4RUN5_9FLAO|nr:hypothetical protein [Profundicola chukchiensis]MDG4945856.1 hypothetical protein [Profundicola chukchiensis]MDG4951286.1 hypothetical protein [Profundicola chukchiensis]